MAKLHAVPPIVGVCRVEPPGPTILAMCRRAKRFPKCLRLCQVRPIVRRRGIRGKSGMTEAGSCHKSLWGGAERENERSHFANIARRLAASHRGNRMPTILCRPSVRNHAENGRVLREMGKASSLSARSILPHSNPVPPRSRSRGNRPAILPVGKPAVAAAQSARAGSPLGLGHCRRLCRQDVVVGAWHDRPSQIVVERYGARHRHF
jgi:hypothetical protein